ncbi:MAG TPA: pyridoxal-dependent decarboxylase [Bryobacteraceae bacterium]
MKRSLGMSDEQAIAGMSRSDFLIAAKAHAEWIERYFEDVRNRPVLPATKPGDLRALLPREAPEAGEPIDRIFADFQSQIVPASTLWNHPRFFGYYPISSAPPAILAEMLAATLNVNAMLWKTSPAATELEEVTLSWLRQWLAIPDDYFGIVYDTASVSTFHALASAREWADPNSRTKGMRPGLTIYLSEHTHSSAEKAAIALGFGQDYVRKIGTDTAFRMRPDLLQKAIDTDLAAGLRPCAVVATVGTTSTASIDPVPAIAGIVEKHNLWLHVDAAYGGSAAVVPEMRFVLDGASRAHSIVLNPHKWLYVPFDLSVFYTRYPDVLKRSSSLSADYLKTAEDAEVVNYMDYGIQLGRRFRALKLWYVMRYYGREGIVAFLRESLRLAQLVKTWVEEDPAFELCAPVLFSLVCFRHKGGNAFNERLLAEINATGKAFLSHTVLNGKHSLRLVVGNMLTTEEDVRETWTIIRDISTRLAEEFSPAAARV